MARFSIWMEGYFGHVAQGDYELAKCIGEYDGETFEAACDAWAATLPSDQRRDYRPQSGRPAYWGRRLFDNEDDAKQLGSRHYS